MTLTLTSIRPPRLNFDAFDTWKQAYRNNTTKSEIPWHSLETNETHTRHDNECNVTLTRLFFQVAHVTVNVHSYKSDTLAIVYTFVS